MEDKVKITAVPNHNRRKFTIRKFYPGGSIEKYRTLRMTKEEFNSNLKNTTNDWQNFLQYSDEYEEIK